MTTKELIHVREILARITNQTPNVTLAIAYINKDLAVRKSQQDNFKGDYDGDFEHPNWG